MPEYEGDRYRSSEYERNPKIDTRPFIISGKRKTKLSRFRDHLKENRDIYAFIGVIVAILTLILSICLVF